MATPPPDPTSPTTTRLVLWDVAYLPHPCWSPGCRAVADWVAWVERDGFLGYFCLEHREAIGASYAHACTLLGRSPFA